MIETLSRRVVAGLLKNHAICEKECGIYQYGCEIFLSMLLNTCFIFFQGILMDRLLETIIFIVCFIPIRVYAGGFHASSFFRCFILTNCMFTIDMGVIYPFLECYESRSTFLLIFACAISWKIAPIIDCDVTWKRPEDMEGYKEKARILIIVLLATVLLVQQIELGFSGKLLTSGTVASLNIVLLLFVANIKRMIKYSCRLQTTIHVKNFVN